MPLTVAVRAGTMRTILTLTMMATLSRRPRATMMMTTRAAAGVDPIPMILTFPTTLTLDLIRLAMAPSSLPTKGTSQAMHWTNNSQLAGDHVAAGSFETACRLLHDQLAVVDFTEYKAVFVQVYTASRCSVPGIPTLPSMTAFPHRNWREAGAKGGLP